jgi:hypothetical protein
MPGRIQKHTLVYTAVIALGLTVFFDLSRIASLGAILYIVMDMAIHWGVYKHLRKDLNARGYVLLTALVLDAVILAAFLYLKAMTDPLIVGIGTGSIALIFGLEAVFLKRKEQADGS